MFKLRNIDGKNAPLIFCDVCAKRIEDGRLAGVIYEKTKDPLWSNIHICHKGVCLDSLEERLGEEYDGWDELYRFLAFVTNNVGLAGDEIDSALKMNRETGL